MTFANLALICAVAILGPVLAVQKWAHLPVVLGELLVGFLLGATGLQVLHAGDPTFTFFGDVGFALVMLVAGAHVPVRSPQLRQGLRGGLLRAVAVGVLAIPAGLALAALFGTGNGPLYAVLLASSSASLVMPSLAGLPLTAPAIVSMLAQIAVADATCIVLLPLAIQPASAPARALGALAVLVGAGVVFLFLRWAERSGRRKAVHDLSEDRGLALELRTSLALLFGLAALAQMVHVSVMLAGFGVGLALAAVGEPRRLAKQLFALTEGFFGPIFFVWLGSSLDLRQVLSHPSMAALGLALGLSAALVHGLMAFTRQPWPVAVVTCAQLGVPVAAATLGRSEGILAPGEDAALLLGALITIGVTAALSGRVAGLATAGAVPQGLAAAGTTAK